MALQCSDLAHRVLNSLGLCDSKAKEFSIEDACRVDEIALAVFFLVIIGLVVGLTRDPKDYNAPNFILAPSK